jgi:hypothetical protein
MDPHFITPHTECTFLILKLIFQRDPIFQGSEETTLADLSD